MEDGAQAKTNQYMNAKNEHDVAAEIVTILERLSSLKKYGGPNYTQKLTGLFFTQTEERLNRLKKSHVSGDWNSLTRELHDLKSSAANIGATDLAESFRTLEEIAVTEDQELFSKQLATAEAFYFRLKLAMRMYVP